MSKPIESGCRAVIFNTGHNNGVIVTVGKYIGREFNNEERLRIVSGHWEVDKSIKYTGGVFASQIDESYLKRIDDNNEKLSSWDEVEFDCQWNPTKETVEEK